MNVTYAFLSDGRNQAELRELDVALADDEERERIVNEANMEALKAMGGGMPRRMPLKPRRAS